MRKVICIVLVLTISSCTLLDGNSTKDASENMNFGRFTCLERPSGIYVPGTIIRTKPFSLSTSDSVEGKPIAYKSSGNVIAANFSDVEKTIKKGLDANITFKIFSDLGANPTLTVNANYTITSVLKNNKHLLIEDSTYNERINFLKQPGNAINGVIFYLVKEAIGSQSIDYVAKPTVGASFGFKLKAANSESAVTLNLMDNQSNVTSSKELVACVYVEKIYSTAEKGSDGEILSVSLQTSNKLTEKDINNLNSASK